MKKNLLLSLFLLGTVVCSAKDIKTVVVTTTPKMHCESCENKIKGNMRFEKGIKRIETNIEKQAVTMEYDADKTTVENLLKGFEKFGYKAEVVETPQKETTGETKK